MKKLLLFSGTFDPFHNGHYMMLKIAMTNTSYDKVIISINKQNPLKNKLPISYQHRLNMAKLGIYDLTDKIEFDDFEAKQDSLSYTCELIKHIQTKYPNYQINFLIGSDNFKMVSQWKNIEQYYETINWIVINRNNDNFVSEKNVIVMPNFNIDISSSAIRKQVRLIDMAPQAIEYMNDYGIYGEERVLQYTTSSRYEHTLRVAKMTMEIMEQYEPEHSHWGWTAGIYHDIAKTWNFEYQGNIGINFLKMNFSTPKILHGYIGAYMLYTQFLFTNKIILNAIARHTKPYDYYPENTLTNLDMALYCADKLEPSRTNEDCNNIEYYRNLLKIDLKKCFTELYNAIQNQFHKEK